MDLDNIMLSERNKIQQITLYDSVYIRKCKFIVTESRIGCLVLAAGTWINYKWAQGNF